MRIAKSLFYRLMFLQNLFIPVKYLPEVWFLCHISIPCQILLTGNAVEESRFRPDGVQYCVAKHCLLQCGRIRKITGLPSKLSNKSYEFMITGMQQCPSQHRVYKQTPADFKHIVECFWLTWNCHVWYIILFSVLRITHLAFNNYHSV